jgi:predicted nucleic acid-binding protein
VLLVDTGPLLATADRDDPDHETCQALLESDAGPLITSPLVIAEASCLLDRQLGPVADAALFRSIADGSLRVEALHALDWTRIADLIEEHADLRLGGTDASLVALGERLEVKRIATLNHRDFAVVRPRHTDAFELLP